MKLFGSLLLLVLINSVGLPVIAKELAFKKQILLINNHLMIAEVAENDQQREVGLMNRKTLDKDQGMLFILDKNASICFWMKNTLIPLSIAFINEQGVITQIEHMLPMTTKLTCSYEKTQYGLEVNQGWFDNNDIEVGMTVEGINHPIPYTDLGWFRLY